MTTARGSEKYQAGRAAMSSHIDTATAPASGMNQSARFGRRANVSAGSSSRMRRRSSWAGAVLSIAGVMGLQSGRLVTATEVSVP